jgi:glycosyltransferase involved in cell wall biosynthesis
VRVVLAHNRYREGRPSGENRVVDLETAALREAGVDAVPFERNSDEIPGMSIGQKLLLPIRPIYARNAQVDLARLIRSTRPDLLHLHNPYPLLSPWIVRTAHAHGVPVVHTIHNFRQVCVSGIYFRDGHVCTDCRGRRFGFPAIVHSCYRGSAAQSSVMATALAVHQSTWRSVDRFIALSTPVAAHIESLGIPAARISVRPNAFPDPGEHSEVGSGFLYAGLLSEEKGVRLLLEAWRRHPEGSIGTLRIVGDGPQRELIERASAERSDVAYLGFVEPRQVRDAMRSAAAVIVPSTCHDVAPMVVTEALANARPVLGTARGGIPFLVGVDDHGDSETPAGWIVEPTADALAAGLAKAHLEAPSLACVARQRYLTKLHPRVLTEALLDVYRSTLAEARLSSPTQGPFG